MKEYSLRTIIARSEDTRKLSNPEPRQLLLRTNIKPMVLRS